MSNKYMLLNSKEVLNVGSVIAGNKAYNLCVLKYLIGIENIPDCLSLGSNRVTEGGIAKKAAQEISRIWKYPIIARSSTNVEDSVVSFAGMFVSEVCTSESQLEEAIIEIIKSPNGQHINEYSKLKSIDLSMVRVSVLFQPYLFADMSGVLFTKNPVTGDSTETLIEYKESTSDAVTSGTARTKCLIIKNNDCEWPYSELYQIGQQVESHFGMAVDIEWIVSNGKLWIVQARQITT